MTLANTSIVNTYVGNGATNLYPFNFPVFQAPDITVVITSPAPAVVYTLLLATDFIVSGLNPAGGPPTTGAITLVSNGQPWLTGGNLTTNWTIVVTRSVSIVQNTSIRNQGDFYQETLESALDYLTMICQQLAQAIGNPIGGGGSGGSGGNTFNTDIFITAPGDGLIVTTPDGTKTYRIGITNLGEISAQELT